MKKFILTVNLFLNAGVIVAQPVFTITNLPAIGVTINFYDVADTILPSQITTGANQYWNFSNLSSQGGLNSTTKYNDPLNTPFYSSFPTANYASETLYPVDSNYSYVDLHTGYYDVLGGKSVSNGTITTITYIDPLRSFIFPFNYGDVFNDYYEYTRTVNTSTYYFHRTASFALSALGYGTLVLPTGTFTNCILLKRFTTSRDSSFILGTLLSVYDHNTTSYAFYDSNFSGAMFSYGYDSVYSLLSGQTSFSLFGGYSINTTSVSESNANGNISIYPNPATNNFIIALANNYENAEVTITDITGKIIYVTTISDSEKTEVNTKDFAAGVYLVKIQTGDFIETKKLIVKK